MEGPRAHALRTLDPVVAMHLDTVSAVLASAKV